MIDHRLSPYCRINPLALTETSQGVRHAKGGLVDDRSSVGVGLRGSSDALALTNSAQIEIRT